MPVVISEPTALVGTATDNTDGTLTASATGGTPGYSYQWDATSGNQTTATATGLIHNNTYTVTITDANGCTTTATVTVTIVGLEDIPNLSEFNILPNPNNGEFTIQVSFAQAQDATVKLTNVLGQELRTYNYSTASFNIPIDIQHQASGVYFVTLQTENKAITRKVVVAK
jgi:VCBS repeat-containing protein